jgi:hypothetical protein
LRQFRVLSSITLSLALLLICGPANAVTATKAHSKHSRKTHARRGAWKRRGQQHIDEQRTREIQAALIREKYMEGEPSGEWDQQTKNALTKYQADHGWQIKSLPDSRALIALGLGPKNDSAATLPPATTQPAGNSFSSQPANSIPLEMVQRQY